MNRRILFIGSAAVMLAAFVAGTLIYQSGKAERSKIAESNLASLVRSHSPTLGSAQAKVHIVEFLDPACETCRAFYPIVKQIMAANADRIRLSVRHVPFHNGSEDVVRMLEAAKKQDKYWPALEALLGAQQYWVVNHTAHADRAWRVLERVGLDLDRVRADMASEEIAHRIEQDLRDAKVLKVTKTPEYFVNGRPLPSFGLEQLQDLVREALADAY
jgi:protein-disulfide isomerase